MKEISIEYDLFYYLEEGYLTWDCPQFTLYGVAPYEPKGQTLENFAIAIFEKKLASEIQRFSETEDFINALLKQGHWKGLGPYDAQPRSLLYFLNKKPILKRLIEMPDSSSLKGEQVLKLSA